MFFVYRKFLQKLVEDQKKEIKELQAQNNKLVEALVPILRRMNEHRPQEIPLKVEIPDTHKPHRIEYSRNRVFCCCGWGESSEDEGKLQELASAHHRENSAKLRANRKGWPSIKNQIEDQTIGGSLQ